MKIKTPTQFQTFDSGVLDVYSVENNRTGEMLFSLPFGDRTVGMQRFYTARAASVKLDRVIYVPMHGQIEPGKNRIGIADTIYSIVQIQNLRDTNPPVYLLSLQKSGVKP